MSSPALSHFLQTINLAWLQESFLPVVVRWLVLISTTILVLFAAGLILTTLWSSPDENSVAVEAFTVVDSSGNLKNAENGFAQMLVARIDDLQAQIGASQKLLETAGAAQSLSEDTAVRYGQPLTSKSDSPLLAVNREIIRPVPFELKVQGVDISGIFSWIRAKLVPKNESLKFTVHMGADGVAIAGDIRALKIDGANTIWIPPTNQSPMKALNELALQLYQLKLAKDNPFLRDFAPGEFGDLIDHLSKVDDKRVSFRAAPERKKYFEELHAYFAQLAARFDNWSAMTILTAETARKAENYEAALEYFGQALKQEQQLPDNSDETLLKRIQHAERLNHIQDSIHRMEIAIAARSQTNEIIHGPGPAGEIKRLSVAQLDRAKLESLRTGFKALYDASGDKNYSAIAGLPGMPGWYSWNHEHNRHSQQNAALFLPWNRAFLVYFERAARAYESDLSLPYWDWTTSKIPDVYMQPADAKENPLYAAPINVPTATVPIKRYTRRFPGPGDQLPAQSEIDRLMELTNWQDFANQLEDLSDRIHILVGGSMGDMASLGTSAFDPLFYAHRCEVDRLWAQWQKLHPQTSLGPALDDIELAPFGIKVRDVLDTRKLGYSYE